MHHVYHIREGGGRVTESTRRETAELIHAGKLKYTGKKIKQSKVITEYEHHSEAEVVLTTFYFYIRVDLPPRTSEVCDKPCCNYIPKEAWHGTL